MPFDPVSAVAGPVVGGIMGWLNNRSRNKQIKEQNRRIDSRIQGGDARISQSDRYAADDNQRMMDIRPRIDANYDRRNELANGLFEGSTGWERVGFNGGDVENELAGLRSRDVDEKVFSEYADTGGWTPERKRLALEEGTAGARQATGNVLNEMRRQGSATGNGLAGFLANRASRDFSRGIGDTTTSALNSINNSIDHWPYPARVLPFQSLDYLQQLQPVSHEYLVPYQHEHYRQRYHQHKPYYEHPYQHPLDPAL